MPHQLLCLEYTEIAIVLCEKQLPQKNLLKCLWFEMGHETHPMVEPLNVDCTEQLTRNH